MALIEVVEKGLAKMREHGMLDRVTKIALNEDDYKDAIDKIPKFQADQVPEMKYGGVGLIYGIEVTTNPFAPRGRVVFFDKDGNAVYIGAIS